MSKFKRVKANATTEIHETVILFNARSIVNKWKAICSEISTYFPSIIAITETWLSEELCQYYTYNNYQQIAKCRIGGRGGGVLMFFAPHLKVVQIALPIASLSSCDVLLVKDITNNHCW